MYKGIDISEFQNPNMINYDRISKNIDFVILRAGFTGTATGSTYKKDAHFDRHYEEFKKRNVPIGAYWYSCANTRTKGIAEAQNFIKIIQGKTFDYPLYIDTEDTVHQSKATREDLTRAIEAFCLKMEEAGYYVGIYASQSWFNERLYISDLKRFDFWVANWSTNSRPIADYAGMWQYSSKGKIEGYTGNLDLNNAYKDYPAIMKQAKLNGYGDRKIKITATKTFKTEKDLQMAIDDLVFLGFEYRTEPV